MEGRIILGRGNYSSNAFKCRSVIKLAKFTHPSISSVNQLYIN